MIVSHEKEFVFVHVPHTSGTSMRKHLKSNLTNFEEFDNHSHTPIPKLKSEYSFFEDYFVFSIVRNHWGWILSAWSLLQRATETMGELMNFNKFVERTFVDNTFYFLSIDCGFFGYLGSELCFVDSYITLDRGNLYGLDSILKRIGINQKEYPHVNKNNTIKMKDIYNERSVEIIRDRFQSEIDFFDFEF